MDAPVSAPLGVRWVGVTVDCRDPLALAGFWSRLLGRPLTSEHDGAGWATVGSRSDGAPRLTFQAVPEPRTAKVRLHLDLQVDDVGRRAARGGGARWEVDRSAA